MTVNPSLTPQSVAVNPAAPALLPAGFLWFCDDKRPTAEKVLEAAAYHRAKGRTITLCVCNPRDYADTPIEGVTLVARFSINPSNFWLGQLDELEGSAERQVGAA